MNGNCLNSFSALQYSVENRKQNWKQYNFGENIVFLDCINRDQFGIDSAALVKLNYHYQVDFVCLSGSVEAWECGCCYAVGVFNTARFVVFDILIALNFMLGCAGGPRSPLSLSSKIQHTHTHTQAEIETHQQPQTTCPTV